MSGHPTGKGTEKEGRKQKTKSAWLVCLSFLLPDNLHVITTRCAESPGA